jgi:hypothetical protein
MLKLRAASSDLLFLLGAARVMPSTWPMSAPGRGATCSPSFGRSDRKRRVQGAAAARARSRTWCLR